MAANVTLYAVPCLPFARVLLVIVSGAVLDPEILMLKALVAVCAVASVTVTEKL